jgi:XTP/dITP diphosphohydrolase
MQIQTSTDHMKLVLGTMNPGKLRELRELARDVSFLELVVAPSGFAPIEDGTTFAENALIKAKEAVKMTGCLSLGEDSGISVQALGERPGIYSARYCEGSDEARRRKLLDEINALSASNRQASYHCAMALVSSSGQLLYETYAAWPGEIAFQEAGTNGFGYDPIFFLPALGKTAAQLSASEKNALSHRALAFEKMLEFLKTLQ